MSRPTKRFAFLGIMYLFCSYILGCFQLDAFVRQCVWYKALLVEYSFRHELTCVCSLNDLQLFFL